MYLLILYISANTSFQTMEFFDLNSCVDAAQAMLKALDKKSFATCISRKQLNEHTIRTKPDPNQDE